VASSSVSVSSFVSTSLQSSKQQVDVALKNTYCKYMFQVFQMF
jgi:hypothetical protein